MAYRPVFAITPHFLRLLEEVNALHAKIKGAVVRVRYLPALQKDVLAREAHGSTAIEGNPLTLVQVKTVLKGGSVPGAPARAEQEIKNYADVMRYIQARPAARRIARPEVLKIHSILGREGALDRGPIGRYRNYGVRVGSHTAPDSREVPLLMDELLEWLREKGPQWPAIVSSAVLHFRFEYIHPFGDGNGRVGRALAAWELYRRRFDTQHIFAVDEVIWENRSLYYRALERVQRDSRQDLSGWIEFVGEVFVTSLERTWMRVDALQKGKKPEPVSLSPNQERLLALIREKPLHITAIQKAFDVTKMGAHYLLKPLLSAGWVRREGGHRTGVYRLVE